jgi:hypothetical protein
MTQTVCRMYASSQTSAAAAETLQRHRALADRVRVVNPPQQYVSVDAIAQAIMNCDVHKSHAKIYAERVYEGSSLIVVHAPLGTASAVISYLDEFQPIDSGVPDATIERFVWDEAAPLSSALRLAVKLDDSTPFSNFWNLPVLTKERLDESELLKTIRFYSDRPDLLSGVFGVPTITNSPAMLSSLFGVPTHSGDGSPLSNLLKLPTRIRG